MGSAIEWCCSHTVKYYVHVHVKMDTRGVYECKNMGGDVCHSICRRLVLADASFEASHCLAPIPNAQAMDVYMLVRMCNTPSDCPAKPCQIPAPQRVIRHSSPPSKRACAVSWRLLALSLRPTCVCCCCWTWVFKGASWGFLVILCVFLELNWWLLKTSGHIPEAFVYLLLDRPPHPAVVDSTNPQ